MAKLAVGAVLSTMLVRFPWFRRILLTEKRDWPERLIFAASLGLPLTARRHLAPRPQQQRRRPDAVGRVPRRPARRPLRRRHRRRDARHPAALRRRMGRAALRDRLRLRRRRPARALPARKRSGTSRRSSSPASTATSGGWCGASRSTGSSSCWPRRSRSRSSQQAVGQRWPLRLFVIPAHTPGLWFAVLIVHGAVGRDPDQDLEQRAHRAPAAGAGKAADGVAARRARQPDQPALPVQHADVDLVADPLAAGERRGC